MWQSINVSILNTSKKEIAMKLVNETFTIDKGSNRCLHVCHST